MNAKHMLAFLTLNLAACVTAGDSHDALGFMSGCWRGGDTDNAIFEQYSEARPGFWLGALTSGTTQRRPFYELLVFELVDGIWKLTPHPGGTDSSVSFSLVAHSTGRAEFANLEHDFPQRIVYELDDSGGLRTTVEGHQNEKPVRLQYLTSAVSCRSRPAE